MQGRLRSCSCYTAEASEWSAGKGPLRPCFRASQAGTFSLPSLWMHRSPQESLPTCKVSGGCLAPTLMNLLGFLILCCEAWVKEGKVGAGTDSRDVQAPSGSWHEAGLQRTGVTSPAPFLMVGSEGQPVLQCGNKNRRALESGKGRTRGPDGAEHAVGAGLGALTSTPPCPLSIRSSARQPACVPAGPWLPGALLALRIHHHDCGRGWGNHVAAVPLLLLLHQACSDSGQVFSTGISRALLPFHVALV